jgi:hypothetical protein
MIRMRFVFVAMAVAVATACGGAIHEDVDASAPVDASPDVGLPFSLDGSVRDAPTLDVADAGVHDTAAEAASSPDVGQDAITHDAPIQDAVSQDALTQDALSVDALTQDATNNDPRCPSSHAAASGGCPAPGLDCTYPEGTCSCPAACAGSCGGCTPKTCLEQGYECGPAGDGCGNLIECGTCPAPSSCGGGGVPGRCGVPDGGSYDGCVPQTCGSLSSSLGGTACGAHGDGCGGLLSCGGCNPADTCATPAGVCTAPPSWSCNAQPCPPAQPGPFTSCASPGLTCTYWSPACCSLPVQCAGGVWQYPE